MIQTVLGVLDPLKLGYCQCHEHLFIRRSKSFEVNPDLYMEDSEKTLEELQLYKKVGGVSIVDAQPVGCGRMAGLLSQVSKASGINIISSTGFHKPVFYDANHWINTKNEDFLGELYLNEIRSGMFDDGEFDLPSLRTASRAGLIKTALSGSGIDESNKKLFNAAAFASLETGTPIMCHIDKKEDVFSVITYLTDLKVKAGSIILCHLDRAHYDLGFHKEVATTGVYLEYDTIGRFKYHNDEKEIDLICGMVENGFTKQILLGFDSTNKRLKSYGGILGLDYIKEVFIGKMMEKGIDENIINTFTVKNPTLALSIKKN